VAETPYKDVALVAPTNLIISAIGHLRRIADDAHEPNLAAFPGNGPVLQPWGLHEDILIEDVLKSVLGYCRVNALVEFVRLRIEADPQLHPDLQIERWKTWQQARATA
jgi:hypothetical protein